MTAANSPGSLGTDVPFALSATIDSGLYAPRNGSTKVTLTAIPTRAGTVQPFLRTPKGDKALTASPAAVVANDLAIVTLDLSLEGLGPVFLRYVNTDATAGMCTFAASDGGGR